MWVRVENPIYRKIREVKSSYSILRKWGKKNRRTKELIGLKYGV